MRRVRFLTHVMGLPGPECVYHEGQVIEASEALVAVIEASMNRHHATDWIVEYEGAVETCPGCGNDFALTAIVKHRTWYHGVPQQQAISERRNEIYRKRAKAEGDLVCIDCTRPFETEQGLKQHRTSVHHDHLKGRDRPPVARENSEQGDAAGDQSPRGFAKGPAVDRPAVSGQ